MYFFLNFIFLYNKMIIIYENSDEDDILRNNKIYIIEFKYSLKLSIDIF